MAEPQKPKAKSQHSGKTRKPPLVDLHAEKTEIPEAEPVVIDANQESFLTENQRQSDKTSGAKIPPESKTETKKSDNQDAGIKPADTKTAYAPDREKSGDKEKSGVKMASDQTSHKNEQNKNGSPSSAQESVSGTKGGSGFSHFVSGVAGGVIALVIGAGLQWSGLLPGFSEQNSSTQNKLANLENEIVSLKQNAVDGATVTAELSSADRQALDKVVARVSELDSKTNAMGQQLSGVIDNVETLNNVANSSVSNSTSPQAAEILTSKFTDIQNRLQTLPAISEKSVKAFDLAQENAQNIDQLKKQVEEIKSALKTPIQGKDVAAITAANALKNAIDRGGSYANELGTLENIAPDLTIFDNLKRYADKGVPNQAELSNDFARVADRIAKTDNQPADNAGFGEKLWAGAKSLVTSRPVGNVEGNSAGAIAARMEVAIKEGDNERALSEWQNLPQSAKDVSSDFIEKLKMRRDADAVLSEILNSLMSSSTPQNLN
ncbi:hypothetical protein [uncultured Bartonella sp.]|uniref:COG4223 family protein n=1 Tax=uncultured Bartonella sp. TaxID=104108 RepID=UPI0025CDF664|nr:hypothetical protein [uncultured Bartonella sp.]